MAGRAAATPERPAGSFAMRHPPGTDRALPFRLPRHPAAGALPAARSNSHAARPEKKFDGRDGRGASGPVRLVVTRAELRAAGPRTACTARRPWHSLPRHCREARVVTDRASTAIEGLEGSGPERRPAEAALFDEVTGPAARPSGNGRERAPPREHPADERSRDAPRGGGDTSADARSRGLPDRETDKGGRPFRGAAEHRRRSPPRHPSGNTVVSSRRHGSRGESETRPSNRFLGPEDTDRPRRHRMATGCVRGPARSPRSAAGLAARHAGRRRARAT
jgi:hypothetical protein